LGFSENENSPERILSQTQFDRQQQGSLAWVIFLSFVATIGGFLFSFDSGVINGTVDALQKAFGSTAAGTGFNVSSMLIGCAVGAFFAGALADRFGRKPLLLATAVAFTISAWGVGHCPRHHGIRHLPGSGLDLFQ
jgi:MFS transporter, SP family, sugar:H+ symporter